MRPKIEGKTLKAMPINNSGLPHITPLTQMALNYEFSKIFINLVTPVITNQIPAIILEHAL
jgi:hypothetical protein